MLKLDLYPVPPDLRALNETCQQQPPIGGDTPIKLNFDLYNTTAPGRPSSTSSTTFVTVTSAPHTTDSSSGTSASERLGLGLGIGLGIPFLAALALLFLRRRSHQHSANRDADLRSKWEAEYKHDHNLHEKDSSHLHKKDCGPHSGSAEMPSVQQQYPVVYEADAGGAPPPVPEKDNTPVHLQEHAGRSLPGSAAASPALPR